MPWRSTCGSETARPGRSWPRRVFSLPLVRCHHARGNQLSGLWITRITVWTSRDEQETGRRRRQHQSGSGRACSEDPCDRRNRRRYGFSDAPRRQRREPGCRRCPPRTPRTDDWETGHGRVRSGIEEASPSGRRRHHGSWHTRGRVRGSTGRRVAAGRKQHRRGARRKLGGQPEYLEEHIELIRRAGCVLTQLEIPLETVEHLAVLCEREKVPLIIDPAPAMELPARALRAAHWFTPNETEAAYYVGTRDPSRRRERFSAWDVEASSSRWARVECTCPRLTGRSSLPLFRSAAVDTTAAGDAFNGAFAVGLVNGLSPKESAIFATAVAAISVTRQGAQPSMPTLEETRELMLEHSVERATVERICARVEPSSVVAPPFRGTPSRLSEARRPQHRWMGARSTTATFTPNGEGP